MIYKLEDQRKIRREDNEIMYSSFYFTRRIFLSLQFEIVKLHLVGTEIHIKEGKENVNVRLECESFLETLSFKYMQSQFRIIN